MGRLQATLMIQSDIIAAGLVLRKIINELATVDYKWFKIGIQLGLPRHVLKRFEKDDDPLSAVIDSWLNGNADPDIPISWSSIVDALKAKSVAEAGLAAEISEEYLICTTGMVEEEYCGIVRG